MATSLSRNQNAKNYIPVTISQRADVGRWPYNKEHKIGNQGIHNSSIL